MLSYKQAQKLGITQKVDIKKLLLEEQGYYTLDRALKIHLERVLDTIRTKYQASIKLFTRKQKSNAIYSIWFVLAITGLLSLASQKDIWFLFLFTGLLIVHYKEEMRKIL